MPNYWYANGKRHLLNSMDTNYLMNIKRMLETQAASAFSKYRCLDGIEWWNHLPPVYFNIIDELEGRGFIFGENPWEDNKEVEWLLEKEY